jgi:hypothetical protein
MNLQDAPTSITSARQPVRQLTVFLDNRVGTMLALLKLLKEHQIVVLGLNLQESAEITLLRMVVNDSESAQTVFMERGISHSESTVTVVELRGDAHDMGHCLSTLLAAEVNVRQCYPLLTRPAEWPVLVLHTDDAEVTQGALAQSGFKTLSQGELSR